MTPTINEKHFEQQICDFANHEFGEGSAQLFGRKGQSQSGIDVIVKTADGRRIAIQCKQTTKNRVPPAKLKDDFERFISADLGFDHFIFATTTLRDAALQAAALEIEKNTVTKIGITIWFWNDFEEKAKDNDRVKEIFDPSFNRNNINPSDYDQPSETAKEFVRASLHELVDYTLRSNYLEQRFNRNLYVEREIERDLGDWIEGSTKKFRKNTTYLVAPAGSGKTCLAASLADRFKISHNVILLPAALIRNRRRLSLLDYAEHSLARKLALEDVDQASQQALSFAKLAKTLIIIDGINETFDASWMKRELLALCELQEHPNLHILLTCRDYYWGAFEDDAISQTANILGGYSKLGSQRKQLADFRFSEYQNAVALYKSHYNVGFEAVGTANEQFRHPLLLRFFCETYRDDKVGVVRNIRLKELFDTYTERKSAQIAKAIQNEVGVGLKTRSEELKSDAVIFLERIAMQMLDSNTRVISSSELLFDKDANQSRSDPILYKFIIDEYIILEEHKLETNGIEKVSFVFEAYMEYCMASALSRSLAKTQLEGILSVIRSLTSKYDSFVQIIGVILFLSLFLKERRNIAIWPALFELGEMWQKVILEAFRKLPSDQIDDGVFDAIKDLLLSGNAAIQIETLELLKHGRLKRPLSTKVINAIKPLLHHKDPKIFRRAIHVVGELPKNQALRLLDYLLQRKGRRIGDWYLISKYTLKYLSRIESRTSFMLEMQVYGAEDFPQFARSHLSKRERNWWLEALYSEHRPTRMGALLFAKESSDSWLIGPIEEFVTAPDSYPKNMKGRSLARSPNEFIFSAFTNDGHSFEMRTALSALSNLRRITKNKRNANRIKRILNSTLTFPHPNKLDKIERIVTRGPIRSRPLGSFELEIIAIKRGLKLRSGRDWEIGLVWGGRYGTTTIRINAPNGSLRPRKDMSNVDWQELIALLDSQRFDQNAPRPTYNIPVFDRYRHYSDEYCFRAWGKEPEIIGYREEYWD